MPPRGCEIDVPLCVGLCVAAFASLIQAILAAVCTLKSQWTNCVFNTPPWSGITEFSFGPVYVVINFLTEFRFTLVSLESWSGLTPWREQSKNLRMFAQAISAAVWVATACGGIGLMLAGIGTVTKKRPFFSVAGGFYGCGGVLLAAAGFVFPLVVENNVNEIKLGDLLKLISPFLPGSSFMDLGLGFLGMTAKCSRFQWQFGAIGTILQAVLFFIASLALNISACSGCSDDDKWRRRSYRGQSLREPRQYQMQEQYSQRGGQNFQMQQYPPSWGYSGAQPTAPSDLQGGNRPFTNFRG